MRPPEPVHWHCYHFSVDSNCRRYHASVPCSFAVAVAATPDALAGMPVEMRSGLALICPPNYRCPIGLASAVARAAFDFAGRPEQRLRYCLLMPLWQETAYVGLNLWPNKRTYLCIFPLLNSNLEWYVILKIRYLMCGRYRLPIHIVWYLYTLHTYWYRKGFWVNRKCVNVTCSSIDCQRRYTYKLLDTAREYVSIYKPSHKIVQFIYNIHFGRIIHPGIIYLTKCWHAPQAIYQIKKKTTS